MVRKKVVRGSTVRHKSRSGLPDFPSRHAFCASKFQVESRGHRSETSLKHFRSCPFSGCVGKRALIRPFPGPHISQHTTELAFQLAACTKGKREWTPMVAVV